MTSTTLPTAHRERSLSHPECQHEHGKRLAERAAVEDDLNHTPIYPSQPGKAPDFPPSPSLLPTSYDALIRKADAINSLWRIPSSRSDLTNKSIFWVDGGRRSTGIRRRGCRCRPRQKLAM